MGNFLSGLAPPAPPVTNVRSAAVLSAATGNTSSLKAAAKGAAAGKAMNFLSGKASLPATPSLFKKPTPPPVPATKRATTPIAKAPLPAMKKPAMTSVAKAAASPAASQLKAVAANKAKTAATGAATAALGKLFRGGASRRARRGTRKAQSRKQSR
jgi:hypothetical protein